MNGIDHTHKISKLPHLSRSNLRDIVLLCSAFSSLIFSPSTPELVFGLALLAAGCLLHVIAKGQLIRNMVLCRTGVYGMVRHPYYLANYVIDSAICLLSGSIYLVALYPFFFFWAYGPTFEKEEAYLASRHGEVFHEHATRTPQVFPHGGVIPGWKGILENFSMKRVSFKEWARVARFWACGFFIVSIHELRAEGLDGLFGGHDADAFLLFGLVVALSVASFLLLARGSRPNQDRFPESGRV
jgi:hypothetical protein